MFTRLLQGRSAGRPRRPWRMRLPGLASQCAVCRSWPSAPVCQACVSRFAPACLRCPHCALELPADLSLGTARTPSACAACMKQAPPTDATLVAVSYAWPWSDLVSRYKFGGHPGWAPFLAGQMLAAPGVAPALASLGASDLILPMPLSGARLQSRGFNQAWELARALAQGSGTAARCEAQLLLRVRDTRPQTELKREARLANVKGAFAVDPLKAAQLAGRRIVLVDDVMTSGASLFTAAAELKSAGASHVTAIAFARTAPS